MLAATVRAGNAVEPPLTPTQIRTLTMLASSPEGLSVNTVAESLGASASATSRLCARLVRDGLVDRAAGPSNELRLSLSAAGESALTALNRHRVGALRGLLRALSAEDRRSVVSALGLLGEAADESSW